MDELVAADLVAFYDSCDIHWLDPEPRSSDDDFADYAWHLEYEERYAHKRPFLGFLSPPSTFEEQRFVLKRYNERRADYERCQAY